MSSRTLVILVLVLAVAAAGPPVDAQQAPKIERIGYLLASTPASAAQNIEAFRRGLRELVKVDVIVTVTDVAIAAVRRETQTIPIVMVNSSDPGNVLDYKETENAARSLRLELQSIEVSSAEDLDRDFSVVTNQRAQAIVLP